MREIDERDSGTGVFAATLSRETLSKGQTTEEGEEEC
jgi:hypothetical protein